MTAFKTLRLLIPALVLAGAAQAAELELRPRTLTLAEGAAGTSDITIVVPVSGRGLAAFTAIEVLCDVLAPAEGTAPGRLLARASAQVPVAADGTIAAREVALKPAKLEDSSDPATATRYFCFAKGVLPDGGTRELSAGARDATHPEQLQANSRVRVEGSLR